MPTHSYSNFGLGVYRMQGNTDPRSDSGSASVAE